jgi:hypothetical protein
MPPVHWPLHNRRPIVELSIVYPKRKRRRRLVADTGGGSDEAPFELILLDSDCQHTDVEIEGQVQLSGRYVGWFNVYSMVVRIPRLKFEDFVLVAGVPEVPVDFDGIACFKFLNRFHYGNFGDRDHFGLAK